MASTKPTSQSAAVIPFARRKEKDRAGLDGPVRSKVVRRPTRIRRELEQLLARQKKD
jgi:hypothetical protein